MATDLYYPPLDNQLPFHLSILTSALLENPGALDHPSCPYSNEMKNALKTFMAIKAPKLEEKMASEEDELEGMDKWQMLEHEATILFKELKSFGNTLTVDDTSERMAYFKTRTSLLEKITSIQERNFGLREMHEFRQSVLALIDDVLTPDQKTEFIQRLEALKNA